MAFLIRVFFYSIFFLFAGCSSVQYLAHLGKGQATLYNRERDFEEILKDPKTDSKLKKKIEEIQAIKKYVEQKLGVKPTRNYSSYVALDRPEGNHYVIWALTVAEAQKLKTMEWSFPIVGSFPYLGFFNEELARSWESEYKAQGYDTFIRGVRAYSTLGYLKDPFLSSMLNQNTEELVNTIFHETIHNHIFLPNHGDFNEQIASFFGNLGEKIWITEKHGSESTQLKEYFAQKDKNKKLAHLLKAHADKLTALYQTSDSVLEQKAELYKKLQIDIKNLGYSEKFAQSMNSNAALLAYLTYEDYPELQEKLDNYFKTDIKLALEKMQDFIKNLTATKEDKVPQIVLLEALSKKTL